MIDWLSVFQNFGYPALITGILLYIIIYKLERVMVEMEGVKDELIKLEIAITEHRNEVYLSAGREVPTRRKSP